MSEISLNTVENIGEVEQISLLTTCTTKLHIHYKVTLHYFLQKEIPKIPLPFYYPPFYYLGKSKCIWL